MSLNRVYSLFRSNIADPDGSEMRMLVDIQNEKRQKPAFDYAKLFGFLEVIRNHQRIESLPKLAKALGIPVASLYALRDNKPVTWDVMLKITDWAQVDLRAFIGQAA